MSKAVEAGLKEAGVESQMFQVRAAAARVCLAARWLTHARCQVKDILSEEVLGKMHANKVCLLFPPMLRPLTLF